MACTNLFRLSPGLIGGTWTHNQVTNTATITLTFSGVAEPIVLTITGDAPAFLAAKNAGIFGYTELPEDETETQKVTDFAAFLAANSVGIMPKFELDDDHGVSVTWCSAITRQPIGGVKFLINRRRAL